FVSTSKSIWPCLFHIISGLAIKIFFIPGFCTRIVGVNAWRSGTWRIHIRFFPWSIGLLRTLPWCTGVLYIQSIIPVEIILFYWVLQGNIWNEFTGFEYQYRFTL